MKVVDPAVMRYPTAGDWEWLPDGALKLTVPDHGTQDHNALLLLLHELVEAHLCKRDGVSEESVTAFDVENPNLEEPGDDPRAPYHRQHQIAMRIESEVAKWIQADWDAHNQWVVNSGNEVERLGNLNQLQKSRITMSGPRYWAELHLFALRQEGKGRDLIPWVMDWFADLPFDGCPCKEHAERWMRDNPPTSANLFEWSVNFHNDVNHRNFRLTLPVAEARKLWESRIF